MNMACSCDELEEGGAVGDEARFGGRAGRWWIAPVGDGEEMSGIISVGEDVVEEGHALVLRYVAYCAMDFFVKPVREARMAGQVEGTSKGRSRKGFETVQTYRKQRPWRTYHGEGLKRRFCPRGV